MDKKKFLSGIEDTLYIPLVSRIYVSERFSDFFYDEKALSLKKYLPENSIENNTNEYFHMASVCRQKTMDKLILEFIEKNKNSNIVFLGAGLETAYNRINNHKVNFYEIDLEDVIRIRKKLLGNGKNEKLIAGDMFTLEWIKEIDTSLATMVVVSGVFQYFKKEKIVDMIQKMKDFIPNGELIFDGTNSQGLKLTNKYVQKTGNTDVLMYFCIDDPLEFSKITGTKLKGVYGFFDEGLNSCKGLKLKTRIYMYFADKLERTKIIHLSFH